MSHRKTGTRFYIKAILLGLMALVSCEKEVDFKLNSGEPKLVVEGAIETGFPPYVILTKSLGYLDKIDLSTLENSFIHGALVKVSDGNTAVTLKEYAVDTGSNGNKFSFYSVDTADPASLNFRGVVGHYYTLTIEHDGKTYSSVTKIPNPKPLDSLWIQKPEEPTRTNIPLARLIYFRYIDPDSFGNCVRYFTKRNQEPFYPALGSVYDDQIINGGPVTTTVNMGYDRSKNPVFDSLGMAYLGDTVIIKWCAIDRSVYNFYSTLEYATNTVGSPFASPVNVRTNISGGALGVWAGYGSSYHTIVVKD